jgi:hypothetical protein
MCPLPGLIEMMRAIRRGDFKLEDGHKLRTPQIDGLRQLLAQWILG